MSHRIMKGKKKPELGNEVEKGGYWNGSCIYIFGQGLVNGLLSTQDPWSGTHTCAPLPLPRRDPESVFASLSISECPKAPDQKSNLIKLC